MTRRSRPMVSSILAAACALALSSTPAAQVSAGGAVRVSHPRAVYRTCKTPPSWVPKLVASNIDQDGNFVEDEIDQLAPLDPVDVILALNATPRADDLARFMASGGTLVYVSRFLSVVHMSAVPAAAAVALGQDVRVAMVFLDREITPFLDKSTAAIRVTESTEYSGTNLEELVPGMTGAGVNVAVIDTGIDAGHESLPLARFVGGLDFTVSPPDPVLLDPDDADGHGTHVAGIIAGQGGPSGPRGVAPGVGLIDVKVVGASGSASMSTIQRAIDECILRKTDWNIGVLHVGMGCPDCDSAGDDPLSEAANRAVQAGIVVVAPMGNDGMQRVPSPAAADDVIAVAALDDMDSVTRADDEVAGSSNTGPRLDDGDADLADEQKPDCAAPGIAILSAQLDTTDGYQALSGTSMAAAHVAGLAALIRQARPEWTPEKVRAWILSSSEPLTAADWEETAGHGEIDAYEALLSVKNLQLASRAPSVAGDHVFFSVWEDQQSFTDLNGDGDTSDSVLHVYRPSTDTLSNLGVAAGVHGLSADGEVAVVSVDEPAQGNTDLNGDGDTSDLHVVHVYQAGTLTNLGFAATGPRVAGSIVAFEAYETANAQDLNGDGDMSDNVAVVHDAATGITTNLGITESVTVTPTMVAIRAREFSQGNTDLNGDGDTSDLVLFVYDVAAGTLENLGLVPVTLHASGNVLLFEASEAASGNSDLNADGDATDRVLHVHELSTHMTSNLALATPDEILQVAGGLIGFQVSEADQGNSDLNGDGDNTDFVIHLHDLALDQTVNLQLASLGYAGEPVTDGTNVALLVSEAFHEGADLNGDGDALDDVLHLCDAESLVTTNLGVSVYADYPLLLGDGELAFRVEEAAEGATDLNGDGDTLDPVLHVHDLATGTTTNIGLASNSPALHFLRVYESPQGATDLNGDGDAIDAVVFARNSRFGVTLPIGLAISGSSTLEDGSTTAFLVSEASHGSTDLNGDGDTTDEVLFVVRML